MKLFVFGNCVSKEGSELARSCFDGIVVWLGH